MKTFVKNLWNDESAQGTAEYVLLISVVVGIVIIFKDKIKTLMSDQVEKLSGQFNQVNQ